VERGCDGKWWGMGAEKGIGERRDKEGTMYGGIGDPSEGSLMEKRLRENKARVGKRSPL